MNYGSYLKFINVIKYSDSEKGWNYISKVNRYVIKYLIKISQGAMENNYLKLILV